MPQKGLVYKWVHYGYVPHVKIGKVLRFKESQIENWLEKWQRKARNAVKMAEMPM